MRLFSATLVLVFGLLALGAALRPPASAQEKKGDTGSELAEIEKQVAKMEKGGMEALVLYNKLPPDLKVQIEIKFLETVVGSLDALKGAHKSLPKMTKEEASKLLSLYQRMANAIPAIPDYHKKEVIPLLIAKLKGEAPPKELTKVQVRMTKAGDGGFEAMRLEAIRIIMEEISRRKEV